MRTHICVEYTVEYLRAGVFVNKIVFYKYPAIQLCNKKNSYIVITIDVCWHPKYVITAIAFLFYSYYRYFLYEIALVIIIPSRKKNQKPICPVLSVLRTLNMFE